ncbi:MAG: Rrf2 family transcriptional regulator [Planctomycetota bacterium]
MRLTLHTDYALRVLLFLAARPDQRFATPTIADAFGISRSHLHKVVRTLAGLGLVTLHRGVGGGVELAREPDEVSIGKLVRALDDQRALVECFEPSRDDCVISQACALKKALGGAQEAFYRELDPLTLGELVRGRRAAMLRALTE